MDDAAVLVELTVDIVAAHVSSNTLALSEIPRLIESVHKALKTAKTASENPPDAETMPAISARSSVKSDHILCMECGKKKVMLRRHLRSAHSMTPDQYRTKFGLLASYPMSAPQESKRRRDMARSIGLGRHTKQLRRKRLSLATKQAATQHST